MVTPEDKQIRVFKTPLIVMVITIYAGYIFFYSTNKETVFLVYLKGISFEVFILCNFVMLSLILYNKKQLDEFLYSFPIIDNRNGLEMLQPIVRTNMYSSLFMILFLAIGSLTAIMSILNHGLVKGVLVAVLSIATAKSIN